MRIVRKVRTSIMVSEDVFRNMRIYATKSGQDISAFAEEALRDKIAQCKEVERVQEEMSELKATIDVSRRLYEQIKNKPDFNSIVSADFIKTITSGIDPKYRDIVMKGITEQDKEKVEESIRGMAKITIAELTSTRKHEQSKVQEPLEAKKEHEQEQKVS